MFTSMDIRRNFPMGGAKSWIYRGGQNPQKVPILLKAIRNLENPPYHSFENPGGKRPPLPSQGIPMLASFWWQYNRIRCINPFIWLWKSLHSLAELIECISWYRLYLPFITATANYRITSSCEKVTDTC